jgi:transcriptional regulator with XRE-family HTH domain
MVMIAGRLVLETLQLLGDGQLSRRKIARTLGISEGTVRSIANNRRPCYQRLRLMEDTAETPPPPPTRCPTCGAMVYAPCLLCEIQRRIAAGMRRPRHHRGEVFEPLGLNLRPEHQSRYELVRKRHRKALEASSHK